jgi:hypothetical protein
LALTASARGEPKDHGPSAVEIEVYCADLRPGDDSTRRAFDLWLDLLRHGKAAPFEPALVVRGASAPAGWKEAAAAAVFRGTGREVLSIGEFE